MAAPAPNLFPQETVRKRPWLDYCFHLHRTPRSRCRFPRDAPVISTYPKGTAYVPLPLIFTSTVSSRLPLGLRSVNVIVPFQKILLRESRNVDSMPPDVALSPAVVLRVGLAYSTV